MAQEVLVQLVDDLDGTTSDDITTVQFSLDGVEYEIDLSAANAEALRDASAEYILAARRTGGRLRRGTSPSGSATSPGEAGQVREWALTNGYELSNRGRIPTHILDAYKQAQEEEGRKQKPKKSSTAQTTRRRRAATKA